MERWKPIPGYDGLYEVSDRGQIRSWYNNRWGRLKHPRLLKPRSDRRNYFRMNLYQNKCRKFLSIHRLVLLTFVGPCPSGMEACHNNGNSADNRLENLRWDTKSANAQDSIRHGTRPVLHGERCGKSKLKENQVREIRQLYATGNYLQKELAVQFEISARSISGIVRWERWTHLES